MSLRNCGVALFARFALLTAMVSLVSSTSPYAFGAAVTGNDIHEINAFVIGAGGVRMQGDAGWSLAGSVGQPAAEVQSGANDLRLAGGFWQAVNAESGGTDRIFANGFDSAPGGVGAEEP